MIEQWEMSMSNPNSTYQIATHIIGWNSIVTCLISGVLFCFISCGNKKSPLSDDNSTGGAFSDTSGETIGTGGQDTTSRDAGGKDAVDQGTADQGMGGQGNIDTSGGTDAGGSDSTIEEECGNGMIDQNEDCDGANLGGATCGSLNNSSGTLSCSPTCQYDLSMCQDDHSSTGGYGATGGTSGLAGSGGDAGSGETCEKGQIEPSEVVIIGESFYALPPNYIQKRIEQNAIAAGSLNANATYRNFAISATWLSRPPGDIPSQFDTALADGPVKFIIMDGGGNDCMQSPCDSCPGIFETLLNKMAESGVQDVIYTRYPEPGNPPGSNTILKQNLDTLMPKMEQVCVAATGLRCHWVDLRPVWVNGDTTDGLHATASGGEHVGDAIWAKMVEECLAQ